MVKLQLVSPQIPKQKERVQFSATTPSSSSVASPTPPKAPKPKPQSSETLSIEWGADGQLTMSFDFDESSRPAAGMRRTHQVINSSPEVKYKNPNISSFGEYRLSASVDGGAVDLCEITPSSTLLKDQSIFESFCLEMHIHEITQVHVKLANSNNNNAESNENDAALFLLSLMQNDIFTHVTFEGFAHGFELIADGLHDKLTSLNFKGDKEDNGWTKKLPTFISNSPRLTSFFCDALTEVKSLNLLEKVLTLSPTLTSLRLPGIQVDNQLFLLWLSEERNLKGLQKANPLKIILPKAKNSNEQNALVDEMVTVFNEAAKGIAELIFEY